MWRPREGERAVAELAVRQHGVVARRQLGELGLGRRAIDHRVETGRLHVIFRGVYAVGHPGLSPDGHRMAAVLAGGEEAVLSHRSAAVLWGIRASGARAHELAVPAPRRSRPRLIQRRCNLASDEVTDVRGTPVTTVPRTLLDLAVVLGRRELRRALHEAEVRRLWDAVSLSTMVERHAGRRGAGVLRALLAEGEIGTRMTRSELEARFLQLVTDTRLPAPRSNLRLPLGGEAVEVDFAWPEHRLVAELDGHATHATRAGFERDRQRDRALAATGWRVVRITWRQLRDEPDQVIADLATMLGARPRPA